jgi:DNA adenine methylase
MKTPLKTHGGKAYLASKIVALMPKHTRYLEPYAGGLSVLLAKPCEGVSEYVNDLNGELTNFWRVLKQTPDRMLRALWGTPVSQQEFIEAKAFLSSANLQDPVNRATAFFTVIRQSRQGLGKDYATPTSRTRRGMNETCSAWWSAIEGLPEVHQRLARVQIYNMDAVELIRKLDSPELLIYADPPYLHETRSTTKEYGKFEMNEAAHVAMLEVLNTTVKARVMISGYPSHLYERYLSGWDRVEFPTANHASSSKVKEVKLETLWKNF